MYDILIRGGDLVDGTGQRRAGVPTSASRATASSRSATSRTRRPRRIDATGKVVTPGFVDVHTHYDAQVFWDGALTPSPLHGVTTALAGNCGFTIAPLSDDPADGDYLMRMLARVEGMPLESLRDGRAVELDVDRASTSTRSRAGSASTPGSWSATRRSAAW